MNKLFTFILFAVFFSNILSAQEVISTGGDYYKNGSGSISLSVGEPVIETIQGTSNILTQGFQQTKLTITEITINPLSDYQINVYPNPAVNSFTIKTNYTNKLNYQLFDSNGKLLKTSNLYSQETSVSVENLASANYFLQISENSEKIKTFQIQKQ